MKLAGIIISQLTPPGRGAVSSILVAGPGAIDLVSRHFSPASGKSLQEPPTERVVFGTIRSLTDAVEEVVIGLNGPDDVEVHCHGGAFAATAVIKVLAKEGAEIVPWQRWQSSASLTGLPRKPEWPWQPLGREDLENLAEQYQGAAEVWRK
jgi:tRNA modification GTPase